MIRDRSAPAAFVAAGLWSGSAFAASPFIDRATRYIDGLSPTQYYGSLGIILLIVAILSHKREWSVILTTFATMAGVISLAAASVIWFIIPEARKGDLTMSERRHHKADVGDVCKVTADCMHGEICVRLRGSLRCYYPCQGENGCVAPTSCVKATSGERVCSQ